MGLGNTSWNTRGVNELGLLVRKLELECLERKKELEWLKERMVISWSDYGSKWLLE